jgi:hypothetical protein
MISCRASSAAARKIESKKSGLFSGFPHYASVMRATKPPDCVHALMEEPDDLMWGGGERLGALRIAWADPSPKPLFEEQRQHPRRRTLKLARVARGDGSVLRCVVRDASEGGVCLVTPKIDLIPPEFELIIETEDPRKCVIAWRSRWRVGISFR